MSARGAAIVVTALALASPALATTAMTTRVTYLAGGSVYVSAGRLDGLAEGDTLQAVHDGRLASFLIVRYLSSHRAACDTLKALAMPALGDEVWYQARTTAAAPPGETAGAAGSAADTSAGAPGAGASAGTLASGTEVPDAAAAGPSTPRRAGRLRGRVGARYLLVDPGAGAGFSQPALDLRLDGVNVGGAPFDLGVDVRSRRTFHGTPGVADDGEARVYRMSATAHDATGHRRVTVGRQLSSAIPAVSLFDGALVEYAGERWGGGIFSGAEPDPSTWAMSGAILQHGGFVSLRGRRGPGRWSTSAGGIASFDHGQPDRQFGFLAASYLDPRLTVSLAEEMDYNTWWKRARGEPRLSLTSTFATARARFSQRASIDAGYDNRRSVRLYRDRLTPETEFDDRYRQGAWVGAAVDLPARLRLETDTRWSRAGTGGDLTAWSFNADATRLRWLTADLRWRSTRFSGRTARGWLHAGGIAVRPWGQTRLDLNGGERASEDGLSLIRTRLRWEGADLDLGLAGRWYLLLSAEHDHGDGASVKQGYVSLSWMF